MLRTNGLYQWTESVTTRFPELSRAQASVLALYSFGMVLARASGLDSIVLQLAVLLRHSPNTLRQRLRELYQPAQVKSGQHRRELDPTRCFAPLLRWITRGWSDHRLVVVLDPTHVGERFIVLTVAVVYQGCAIPVAWHVLAAQETGSWNEHWRRLLGHVLDALGNDWNVLVLTDRGLESRDLFQTIVAGHAHPLMRVKAEGTFRPEGWHRYHRMSEFAAKVGRHWRGRGVAYQKNGAALPCTLLACWSEGHEQPWLLLTDLDSSVANPAWYAFRVWIEQGFKVIKSGGWQWQRSRVTEPMRAARVWAALALATLWLIEVGQEAEKLVLPPEPKTRTRRCAAKNYRVHRLFKIGLAVIHAHLERGETLPQGLFHPQPWPNLKHRSDPLTEKRMKHA